MDLESPDLYAEMCNDSIVIAYLRDEEIAVQFYSALCNMRWKKDNFLSHDEKLVNKLKGIDPDVWSCSWRAAGGYIANIRNTHYNKNEGYLDFYCRGDEGVITPLVEECFDRMGWVPYPWPEK